MFLYRTRRSFEEHLADRLFGKILADQPPNWHERPCDLVLALIETFNWFGKLLTDDGIPLVPGTSSYEDELRERNAVNRKQLRHLCIDELLKKYAV